MINTVLYKLLGSCAYTFQNYNIKKSINNAGNIISEDNPKLQTETRFEKTDIETIAHMSIYGKKQELYANLLVVCGGGHNQIMANIHDLDIKETIMKGVQQIEKATKTKARYFEKIGKGLIYDNSI